MNGGVDHPSMAFMGSIPMAEDTTSTHDTNSFPLGQSHMINQSEILYSCDQSRLIESSFDEVNLSQEAAMVTRTRTDSSEISMMMLPHKQMSKEDSMTMMMMSCQSGD